MRTNARPLSNRGGRISSQRVVRTGNGNQLGVVISRDGNEGNSTDNEIRDGEVEPNNENYTTMLNQMSCEINRLNQELSAQRELNGNRLLNSQQRRETIRSRSRSATKRNRRLAFKEAIKHRMVFTGDGDADYEDWREQV